MIWYVETYDLVLKTRCNRDGNKVKFNAKLEGKNLELFTRDEERGERERVTRRERPQLTPSLSSVG